MRNKKMKKTKLIPYLFATAIAGFMVAATLILCFTIIENTKTAGDIGYSNR